uniref:(California timema) hypothetical protein n=1 Tax=Timema californicum TaxID=61474 RepID=A0A7R9P3W5_TIMCA|nr:unnamed protein product [Timema californicum]
MRYVLLRPLYSNSVLSPLYNMRNDRQSHVTVCSAFKTGMGCIEEYANQCLSPRDHKVLEDHVAGAKHTFRFLCDDPGFQKAMPHLKVVMSSVVWSSSSEELTDPHVLEPTWIKLSIIKVISKQQCQFYCQS